MSAPGCERLEWDSDFFGFGVGRVPAGPLGDREARSARAWALESGIRCVYYLATEGDTASQDAAMRVGFRPVSVRVELEHAGAGAGGSTEAGALRAAVPEDAPALAAVASTLYDETRFGLDPGFPMERVRAMYARWIQASLAGRSEETIVADLGSGPVGFVTCDVERADGAGRAGVRPGSGSAPERRSGRIGLLGVAESVQGQGLGGALVRAALASFQRRALRPVRVVTQGENQAALAVYLRAGFEPVYRGVWMHLWPDPVA